MSLSSARLQYSLKAPSYSLTPPREVLKSPHTICCLSQRHETDGRNRLVDREGNLDRSWVAEHDRMGDSLPLGRSYTRGRFLLHVAFTLP